MRVLICIEMDGKVKRAKYGSSSRAIEPIYSLLELIFIVQLSRESFGICTVCLIAHSLLSRLQSNFKDALRTLVRAI